MSRVILLTRPLPVRDGVAEALHAAGRDTLSLPTLQVQVRVDSTFEAHLVQSDYAGVVCVSQHAVAFVAERLDALGWDFAPQTWFAAVGVASAQALRQVWPNACIVTPTAGDSQDTEGLWRALANADLIHPQDKILIVRAQIGRDALRHRLQEVGTVVDIWACYQRDAVSWSDLERQEVLSTLNSRGLVLSITSIEGLDSLLKNLYPISADLWHQPLVTLHPAIAKAAQQYGFERIVCVAPHEMSAALLAQRD